MSKFYHWTIAFVASLNYQQAVGKSGGPILKNIALGQTGSLGRISCCQRPANRKGKALSAHMTKKLKTLINLFSQRRPK